MKSKCELDPHLVRWHKLALLRLMGYLAPVFIFILLVLWFRPQNQLGWVAVMIGTAASCMLPLATLSQARSEAHRRAARFYSESELSLFPAPATKSAFSSAEGAESMEAFLARQP